MKPVFADTFYLLALLHLDDVAHARALGLSETRSDPLLTTAWVVTEAADALAIPGMRESLHRLLAALRGDPACTIVPPTQSLFDQGVELCDERPDKGWSLTDCISNPRLNQEGNLRTPLLD